MNVGDPYEDSDLDQVLWEFNEFCNGNHPCFSGRNGTPLIRFDGFKMSKDLRVRDPMQKAVYFRYSPNVKDTKVLQGSLKRKTHDFDELQNILENEEEFEDCYLLQEPI